MKIQQLGYVASGKRKIQPMGEYAQLVEKGTGSREILMPDGSVDDTVGLMKQMVAKYGYQVKKLAKKLLAEAGGNPNSPKFYKRIFDFCYTHIQYKEDEQGIEQLREPAKSIKDAVSGIDCDCYSILVASLLKEGGCTKKIDFKVIKINNGAHFQHIYVIVDNYIIDPVVDDFNSEAKGITERKLFGLAGIPIQQLGNVATVTLVNGSYILNANNAVITEIDGRKITDKDIYAVKIPTDVLPILATVQNPFTKILANAFKNTKLDKTPAANTGNISVQTGRGVSVTVNPNAGSANMSNLPFKFNGLQGTESDLLKQFANGSKDLLKQLPLGDLIKTYENVSTELKKVSTSTNIAAADLLTNEKHINSGKQAIEGTLAFGATGLTAIYSSIAVITLSTGGTGGLIIAGIATIAGILYGVYKILPEDAKKKLGEGVANFGDWVSGKGPSKMTFNNFEGWEAKDVDVNVYGNVIRAYREGMTGDKSGLGIVEQPADYLPILLRIYKAAPLPIGGSFEINPEIAAAHTQWDTAMKRMFGNEFWKAPAWGKYRAFLCAPFIAEIVYKETYEKFKLQNRAKIMADMQNFNFALVDNLYLNDQLNAVEVLLLLTKKKELDYEALRAEQFPISPTVAAGFTWVGGQDKGAKIGLMTNSLSIGLKPNDKVQVTVTEGDKSYEGIHTVAYLGTDDGQHTTSLVTLNTKSTGKQAKGTISLLQDIDIANGPTKASTGLILGGVLGLIVLGAIFGKKADNK